MGVWASFFFLDGNPRLVMDETGRLESENLRMTVQDQTGRTRARLYQTVPVQTLLQETYLKQTGRAMQHLNL